MESKEPVFKFYRFPDTLNKTQDAPNEKQSMVKT